MSGPRVLVTGASGFLARHLRPRLRAAGAEVHVVSRRPLAELAPREHPWTMDVVDEGQARALVQAVKPDVLVHLAALTHAAPDLDLVLPTFHSALASTVNLLTAATTQGCRRIVLAGSVEEPIAGPDVRPASPYAAAKWAASAYGRMFHALYGAPVVIARLALTYGPGQRARKVIPTTIRALLRGEAPRLSSATRAWDVVYVEDAVDALARIIDGRAPDGATVDIGTGRLIPLKSVVEQLVAMIDPHIVPTFGALTDRPLPHERAADAAATAELLGWRATTSLETGLGQTIDWYRMHMDEVTR